MKVPGGGVFFSSFLGFFPVSAVGFGGSGDGFWSFYPSAMAEGSALSVNLALCPWCVGETRLVALGSCK